jgi:hypothetical protein
MADFLSDLAAKAGLDRDQAHQGLGGLLALLESRLGPDAFAHLKAAIPNSDSMLASAQDKIGPGGAGLVEGLKNLAGKLLGGGGPDLGAALQNHLSSAGVSADQLNNFLPKLREMLAGKLPPNVLQQIEEHLPGFSPAEEATVAK